MSSISFLKWPYEKSNSDENFLNFWEFYFYSTSYDASDLLSILEKTGIPQKYSKKDKNINLFLELYLKKYQIFGDPSFSSKSGSSSEKIALAFYENESLSPFQKIESLENSFLEFALHNGWDELVLKMLKHPEVKNLSLETLISNYGLNGTNKNSKIPWLHFLAQTDRIEVLNAFLSIPSSEKTIDIKDKNLRSPIFYIKNEKMLQNILNFNPDLTLKGKDNLDLVSTWSALGVPFSDCEHLKKSLPLTQDLKDIFSNETAQINAWVKGLLKNLVKRNSWQTKNEPFDLPKLDLNHLKTKIFKRSIGGNEFEFSTIELMSLILLETKNQEEQDILSPKNRYRSEKLYENITKSFEVLLPLFPPTDDSQNLFLTHLVLKRILNTNVSGVNSYNTDKFYNSSPILKKWEEEWKENFNANPFLPFLNLVEFGTKFNSVFNRTGKLTKSIFQMELLNTLKELNKSNLEKLWSNNTSIFQEETHTQMWEKALRSPLIAKDLLEHLLKENVNMEEGLSLISGTQKSAFYASATQLYIFYTSAHEYYQKKNDNLKKLKKILESWVNQGIPWNVKSEDYKFAKSEILLEDELGLKLSTIMQKGRLNKKINQSAPEFHKPFIQKKRL